MLSIDLTLKIAKKISTVAADSFGGRQCVHNIFKYTNGNFNANISWNVQESGDWLIQKIDKTNFVSDFDSNNSLWFAYVCE